MESLPDILLVDKPKGITSFDVIRRLRQRFPKGEAPKMGHAGTLDPLATGLMIIGVGPGTKKLAELIKLDKEYEAEILLGERRSTGDMAGEVLEETNIPSPIAEESLKKILSSMIKKLVLPVSAYSAIKKDGVPMYKRARVAERRGEQVDEVPIREMVVYAAEFLSTTTITINETQRQLVRVRFAVGSGTYIRSLAEEFGKRLGYPATLHALRRTQVGEFRIEDAIKI